MKSQSALEEQKKEIVAGHSESPRGRLCDDSGDPTTDASVRTAWYEESKEEVVELDVGKGHKERETGLARRGGTVLSSFAKKKGR